MLFRRYLTPFVLLISLLGCQKKQNTLEGLVDASAHEDEFYETQISFLDDIIAQKTDDASLYGKRGGVKVRKKDYVGALEDFEQAIQLDSTHGDYYFGIATSHYFLGNTQDAVSNGKKAIALGYRHPQLKTFIGSSYTDLSMYDSAIYFLKSSLEEIPQNSKTYRALGNTYARMDNPQTAILNYQKAIDLDPLDSISYAGIIEENIILNDLEKAIATYQEAKEMSLASPDMKYSYGIILSETDQYDSAFVVFEEVLKEIPSHWKSSRQLGKLYRRRRQPLEANKIFLEGLKYNPDTKELWYELGLTNQYVLRNYAEARKNYEKALEIDPNYKDARLALINLKATLRKLYAPPAEEDLSNSGTEGESQS
ncbi:tetratricopeptide repeat protein [Flammeovirga aprica]|uniref:Tetratricopeptide repeat protein n=1 Tax=Flammeovirga aprica JL-4 TaxID=694437 RepID=A0A7X9RYQ1_9BACT|nr:tetratricopeptide repeat protein [Flammeovirga aprica]NME71135.1 tetratricopeptide repeat protein [Flammeovirga aprica JL-4]